MKKKLFLLFSMGLMVFSDTNSELMKKMETFYKDAFYEFNEGNGSNLALGDGMQKVAANSDKILNETYGKLMNSLNKTDKKNLLNAQRSWVKLDNGIKEYNYALFNRYITGREGELLYGPTIVLGYTESRIFFFNTYLERKNKNIDNDIKIAFDRFDALKETSLSKRSLKDLDDDLNNVYVNVISVLEKDAKDDFYETRDKKTFNNTVNKIKLSQREWIKYRDLNFKFIDENEDFNDESKELMKRYVYSEILNYYNSLYAYFNQ